MARDKLAVLARLRRLQVEEARRAMATSRDAASAAALRLHEAEAAIQAEAEGEPGDYARFLPAGLAARARATTLLHRAEAVQDAMRVALADARAGERAVEQAAQLRATQARQDARAREQAVLDDVVGGRSAVPGPGRPG
jgi:hypothetical protein